MKILNDYKGNADGTCILTLEDISSVLDMFNVARENIMVTDAEEELQSKFLAMFDLMKKHNE